MYGTPPANVRNETEGKEIIMLGLMKRDLLVQRKRLWAVILYCVGGPLVFRGMGQGALVAVVVAVQYMLLLTAFAYDDKYKVDATLASLPLSRDPLVIVRYLEVPLLALFAMLGYMLVTGIGRPWMEGMFPTGWVLPAAALFATSLMSSLYMPVIYKVGYVKARIFNMVIFMACLFVPSFAVTAVMGSNTPPPPWLVNMPENTAAVALLLASVLILAVSCRISLRIFRTKAL